MYGRLGVNDDQLNTQLDGFISEALKTASTQFTLDQALTDRGAFTNGFVNIDIGTWRGQKAPVDQLYINLEAVKVIDINVGDQYAKFVAKEPTLKSKSKPKPSVVNKSKPSNLTICSGLSKKPKYR
jgi:hypothetical protein